MDDRTEMVIKAVVEHLIQGFDDIMKEHAAYQKEMTDKLCDAINRIYAELDGIGDDTASIAGDIKIK